MDKKYITARVLRKNMTPQECKLWNLLKNRQLNGIKFVRQYPIGPYIVDFASRREHIVIELDGRQHNIPENISNDNIRTEYLISQGYKVIRFWNNDIDDNIDGVYLKLLELLNNK